MATDIGWLPGNPPLLKPHIPLLQAQYPLLLPVGVLPGDEATKNARASLCELMGLLKRVEERAARVGRRCRRSSRELAILTGSEPPSALPGHLACALPCTFVSYVAVHKEWEAQIDEDSEGGKWKE